MLAWEINCQVLDRGELLVGYVLKEAPERLCRPDIPCLYITGNLVVRPRDSDCCTVRPLIDILVDILYGLNCYIYLNV